MYFVKFYFLFFIGLSIIDLVNYFILDMNITSLVGLLSAVSILLTIIAIFKFRKIKLVKSIKLFPILVMISFLIMALLMSQYAGNALELAESGSGTKVALGTSPYWILLIDKGASFIFMVYAVYVFRKLKNY